jgi:hypothetical protein
MMDWNDPLFRKIVESLPQGAKAGDYATSLEVTAHRGALGKAGTSTANPCCCRK